MHETSAVDSRLDRLKALGETFWAAYGDGPMESRWPDEPGRYAIQSFSDRYGQTFWDTYDSREEAEAELLTGDADRLVDLDTAENIPFGLSVRVEWPCSQPVDLRVGGE